MQFDYVCGLIRYSALMYISAVAQHCLGCQRDAKRFGQCRPSGRASSLAGYVG